MDNRLAQNGWQLYIPPPPSSILEPLSSPSPFFDINPIDLLILGSQPNWLSVCSTTLGSNGRVEEILSFRPHESAVSIKTPN